MNNLENLNELINMLMIVFVVILLMNMVSRERLELSTSGL
jgi:hypothetical protein